jgi:hypothetical protein
LAKNDFVSRVLNDFIIKSLSVIPCSYTSALRSDCELLNN